MKDRKIIRIINEEVSKFDYLGNDSYTKETEISSLLETEEFQKQFIIDSIVKPTKIKLSNTYAAVRGDWESRDSGELGVEYDVVVDYTYDVNKEPIKISLGFEGSNVTYRATSKEFSMWFNYIEWSDVTVYLFSMGGDGIKFTAYENAPQNIKDLFIRTYLEPVIEKKTSVDIEMANDKNVNTNY